MMPLRIRFVLTCVLVLPLSLLAAQPDTLITASDLLKINQLSSPALSPDGLQVVYVDKTMVEKPGDKKELGYRTQLWIAATDGKGAHALTQGDEGASSPQWNPAGTDLAFVRKAKDKPQIFILPMQGGGEAWQLTQIEQGAGNPRWSPDGKSILFTVDLSLDDVRKLAPKAAPAWSNERPERKFNDTANWSDKETPKDKQPPVNKDGSLAERREWLAKNETEGNPRVTNRLDFLGESDLEPLPSFTHVFVIGVKEGAKPLDLTPGYATYGDAEWTSDGRIVLTGPGQPKLNPDRDLVNSLYIVKADGSDLRLLREAKDYSLSSPKPSPDGKSLAFLAQPARDLSYGQTVVGLTLLDGKDDLHLLTKELDRTAGNLRWSADSKALYFTAASDGGFPLYRVGIAEKATPARLTDPTTGVTAFDLNATRLAYVLTQVSDPYELYAATPTATDARVLTVHNRTWLQNKTVCQPEHRVITRPDGLKIDAWVMKPASFDAAKKYPLLVEIHGGPSAMWGPGEASSWHEFQYFTARGYVVLYTNPRGSGGYGYAFQKANFQNWGVGPSGDVLAAADEIAKESWVDASRQVVMGGSYGGYLTAWIISHDHRFKAAVAVRGVYDLVTFFGEGNAWRLVPEHFGGYPWDPKIRAILEANSPFTFVDQITTPVLIKHGDNDLRTGFVQSEMLFKALKVLDRPVEYARYPRATHELSRSGEPLQRLDRLVRFDEFFRRYIGEN